MKSVFTFLLLGGVLTSFSQTKRIAYLSHSGSLDAFEIQGGDSFGLPPMTIDSLIFINDTTLVQVSSIGGDWHVQKDTMINHPLLLDENIDVDSMKYYYRGDDTKFVGFESSRKCGAINTTTGIQESSVEVQHNLDYDSAGSDDTLVPLQKKEIFDVAPKEKPFDFNVDIRDTMYVDTLVKPKESIISRQKYKKNEIIPVGFPSDADGGLFFRWTVGVLFAFSFLFFVFLNYRQSKLV
ncbi:MAG: hypothetical protein MK078_09580 [Crocinitomicaceae bacterium]|nr:hypothetical protein [Crocinitomicaceae bacterium]